MSLNKKMQEALGNDPDDDGDIHEPDSDEDDKKPAKKEKGKPERFAKPGHSKDHKRKPVRRGQPFQNSDDSPLNWSAR